MTVQEFEDAVWEKEGIRIVVRAPVDALVEDYSYSNRAQQTWRVTQLIENRIRPKIGELEVVVIEGNGEQPHGRTLVRTLRNSYDRG